MQFYRSLILMFLLKGSLLLSGAPVDPETALTVARNFYYERSNGMEFVVASTTTLYGGGQVLLYIFNERPGNGFVMISGDDGVYPVPGYSLTKNWHHDTLLQSPAFRKLLDHYQEQIIYHIDYALPATAEAIVAWNHYHVSPQIFSPANVSSVAPLLGPIEWGQGCYYNEDCPSDPNAGAYLCNKVPVGCVATSMGMVMKYWNFPAQGTGSNTYTHPTYGVQSANFGASTYNWSQIPNVANTYNTELAKINYHAGVAVDMQYGPTGSGAYSSDARNAMVNNFGFLSSVFFDMKGNHTTPVWESMMKGDLDLNRPLIYRGNDQASTSGHAWVIDGYQAAANNHFHCNWGWDGYFNGYFYLTALTPGSHSFTYNQGAIFGLQPPVTQPPVANFSVNPDSAYVGHQISFTCSSTGFPSAWKWFFGDGDSSTLQNPVHTYQFAGTYDVTLIAYNLVGSDTMTKINHVTITVPPLPVAEFSATPLTVPVGLPVQFTDQSLNAPISWLWDFGDGQTSTLQNPQHAYQLIDTFSVKLIVTNTTGIDSITKHNYIITTPHAPDAQFSANPYIAYPGDTIWFTDLSQHTPDAWVWDFGDGDTSHLQNPWHIYQSPGAYSVSLNVSNPYGNTALTKAMYVFIKPLPPMPKAWFASDVNQVLTGESVTFTDYSFSQPQKWQWHFPGGVPDTSSIQHPGAILYPTHGVYDVQLIVWNLAGSDTLLRENFVTVGTIGVEKPAIPNQIELYPVPASDQLSIRADFSVRKIILVDGTGRTVLLKELNQTGENYLEVSVAQITPGYYHLRVFGENEFVVKPLIISR
jgi:PKD repeat protein